MINVNQHPFENQKIITADLYKGSIIEKAYGGGDEATISAEIIRVQLNNKLEKGIISEELHAKAIEQLDGLLEKGGEGSRGGKIIGHTKSGKPVYAGKKASENKDFTAQDHKDASDLHSKQSSDHRAKVVHPHNTALADHHHQVSNAHQQEAAKQIQNEHESGLSADEKKIIADQKKKQISHHIAGHDHHEDRVSELNAKKNRTPHEEETLQFHKEKMEHHKREKERLEEEDAGKAIDAQIALSKEKGTFGQFRGRAK